MSNSFYLRVRLPPIIGDSPKVLFSQRSFIFEPFSIYQNFKIKRNSKEVIYK